MSYCVTTIAVGNRYYYNLAENLLRSFLLWNSHNDIEFLLLTDNSNHFAAYKHLPSIRINVIDLAENDKSFTSKFLLYKHAIAFENLFIDCDCLIYKDLTTIFEEFKSYSFSAIGNSITRGDFFCNVKSTLSKFNLNALPKFVGSVYYFKKDTIAEKIFNCAADLKANYDSLGFVRLRNKENEEPLFAVAMALNNEHLLNNNGFVKADLMYYKIIHANILAGLAITKDPIRDITGGENIPVTAKPAILHFNGAATDMPLYRSEVFRLNHLKANKNIISLKAWMYYQLPYSLKQLIKNMFRPIYHIVFGSRSIKQNQRL